MTVIGVIWMREVKRYLRSRLRVIATLSQPLMYLLVLGAGLGPTFQQSRRGSYLAFVAPGAIAMALLFTSMVAGIGVLWDRQFGFLKETLVAPVPRLEIMVGKTLGGVTVALIQGGLVLAACVAVGVRPAGVAAAVEVCVFMVLTALMCAAAGTFIGATLREAGELQFVMSFVITPLFFCSGALYPVGNLPPWLKSVVWLNPLSYGVDGLRGAFGGATEWPAAVSLTVLALSAAVALIVGAWAFSRIEI